MIRVLLLLLVVLVSPLSAALWKDDSFGCTANLPDSQGWQPVQSGDIPGLTVLVSMQNPARGAVFGITALSNPPTLNLRDTATQQAIETMLKGFGYTWIGVSTTRFGGLDWRQYNVTAGTGPQAANGVVRYTVGNGHIFAVTLLVTGGAVAAQDVELQASASSVRLYPPVAAVASAPPSGQPAGAETPASKPAAEATPDQEGLKVGSGSMSTMLITAGAALAFIVILLVASSRGRK